MTKPVNCTPAFHHRGLHLPAVDIYSVIIFLDGSGQTRIIRPGKI